MGTDMDRVVPQFVTVRRRLWRALVEFFAIVLYLYICFGSLVLYKAAILHGQHIDYRLHGLAAVKALFLGKFILLGDRLRIGNHFRHGSRIGIIIGRSVLFILVLAALTVAEGAIVAAINRRPITEALAAVTGTGLEETLAIGLLLLLILIPYFTYRELELALGEGRILALLRRRI
jgi:hypothetical protein